jgi:hypothetical protein
MALPKPSESDGSWQLSQALAVTHDFRRRRAFFAENLMKFAEALP